MKIILPPAVAKRSRRTRFASRWSAVKNTFSSFSSHTSLAGRSYDVVVVLFICADVGFRLLSIL